MELRVLKYFLAVAQQESISKAAEVLHVTQPTLSRQLMDLETELKTKLLVRGKRNKKIVLTSDGKLLKARAQEIVELANKTESEFLFDEKNISGDIYIGGGESDSMRVIARVIKQISKEYPNIKLIGAIPCKTQDKLWNEKDKQKYKNILSKLDGVRCIYDDYIGPKCMFERNQYMINNSSLVIALFNGKNGGTKKTLDYAKSLKKPIIVIDLLQFK